MFNLILFCLWGVKLPLRDIVIILYQWDQEMVIKHKYNILFLGFNWVLQAIQKTVADKKVKKIGGFVEVDETFLGFGKNHVFRVLKSTWCVEGFQEKQKKFFLL
ncbi:hypothetical protein CDIK_0742 [Cucumispora dikerogammari]|nr:hypothetical protein CDIK_0742 [Cucumispora dikerogammari]